MESFMDIGDSHELRQLVSQTDVCPAKTIPIVLDEPHTLCVKLKQTVGSDQMLAVNCIDQNGNTVVLHLPYEKGARASAHLIRRSES